MNSAGQAARHWPRWAWVACGLALVVALGIVLGTYLMRRAAQAPGEVARQAVQGILRVAEGFRKESVSTEFASYATRVAGTTRLQTVTLREVEIFERTDHAALFWGQLPLPDVVVEARAPVEYVYYLDLRGQWRFELDDRRISVQAPRLEWNRPAADVSQLRFTVRSGSVLRDEAAAQEALRTGLMTLLDQRALEHVPLVREEARRRTAEFVVTWLAHRFSDGAEFDVVVSFADEVGRSTPSPRD